MPKKALWVSSGVALAAIAIIALWVFTNPASAPKNQAAHPALYIWQNDWSLAVDAAVARASDSAREWMVLSGEFQWKDWQFHFAPTNIHWPALKGRGNVTLVFRGNSGLSAELAKGGVRKFAEAVLAASSQFREQAAKEQVEIQGIQIDYDCPTARLADYGKLLHELRKAMGAISATGSSLSLSPISTGSLPANAPHLLALSITALPTWTTSRDFAKLVKPLDYFVLQVHSLELPKSPDDPIVICNRARIPGYVKRLRKIATPYYVALPTCGYEIVFNGAGKLLAVRGEGPPLVESASQIVKRAMTDETEMAQAARELEALGDPRFLGIAWFRLPVDTDRLNWSWPALQAVMQGRAPRLLLEAEVRNPSSGLYEIWLANKGERNCIAEVAIPIQKSAALLASDLLNNFHASPDGAQLIGHPPPAGAPPIMVGWFRAAPAHDPPATHDLPIQVGKVSVLP